ncbi:MAG: glycosyltransferase family 39 protein [Gemmatimonadaceae bacterium]
MTRALLDHPAVPALARPAAHRGTETNPSLVHARDRSAWILLAILASAAMLRLWGLTDWAFEEDELYTLRDAEGITRGFATRTVYFFLQHLILQVATPSPLSLRALPFAFGLLGVWMTWRLARDVFGERAAPVAALLVALSPWHLYASQFARYWTLVYLLATVLYFFLFRAVRTDRAGDYGAALAACLLGALVHPTLVFPFVGVAIAVPLLSPSGSWSPSWPTRRAWTFFWGPLALLGAGLTVAFLVTGLEERLFNGHGRGLVATLRLVPAMIQWISPVVAVAGVVAMTAMLVSPASQGRQWAALALAGCAATVVLLLLASMITNVYADYGMAMLPLLYVSIGGLVQSLGEHARQRSRAVLVGAIAVLTAATIPGVASHLSDGSRFDYRPAYDFLKRNAGDAWVVGGPVAIQRHYAPGLRFQEIQPSAQFLEQALAVTSGFWYVGPVARYGIPKADTGMTAWLDGHCRTTLRTEGARFDYRRYLVEVKWCGGSAPDALAARVP